LDHVNRENVFDAHFIYQYIAYICMHCWHTLNQNSPLPQFQCFRLACEDPNNITFSDRTFTCFGWVLAILRQHFCEPFLRGGVRATFLPNDADAAAAAAAAAASAETRACRDGVPGVYEDLRLLVPAVLRRLVRECTSYISHFN
jgi:hypothetical protein